MLRKLLALILLLILVILMVIYVGGSSNQKINNGEHWWNQRFSYWTDPGAGANTFTRTNARTETQRTVHVPDIFVQAGEELNIFPQ